VEEHVCFFESRYPFMARKSVLWGLVTAVLIFFPVGCSNRGELEEGIPEKLGPKPPVFGGMEKMKTKFPDKIKK
jgi:hypothetical protein